MSEYVCLSHRNQLTFEPIWFPYKVQLFMGPGKDNYFAGRYHNPPKRICSQIKINPPKIFQIKLKMRLVSTPPPPLQEAQQPLGAQLLIKNLLKILQQIQPFLNQIFFSCSIMCGDRLGEYALSTTPSQGSLILSGHSTYFSCFR